MEVTTPDGTKIQLPRPDQDMSRAELAKYGLEAGRHGIHEAVATAKSLLPLDPEGFATRPSTDDPGEFLQALPQDVVRSNGQVDMIVRSQGGKGRTVIEWSTVGRSFPVEQESFATFYLQPGNIVWAYSRVVHGHTFFGNTNSSLPFAFKDGEILCVTWLNLSGKPCIKVKK